MEIPKHLTNERTASTRNPRGTLGSAAGDIEGEEIESHWRRHFHFPSPFRFPVPRSSPPLLSPPRHPIVARSIYFPPFRNRNVRARRPCHGHHRSGGKQGTLNCRRNTRARGNFVFSSFFFVLHATVRPPREDFRAIREPSFDVSRAFLCTAHGPGDTGKFDAHDDG